MQSEQINELATALAKAQGEMKAAAFNRVNPHFKNRYADLAAIFDAIRAPLSKNGLAVAQIEGPYGDGFYLTTTLLHSSGQWLRSQRPLPINVRPQEYGSALTYARRYSLCSIVGIAADEDDDANAAQNAKESKANGKTAQAVRNNPHVNKPEDITEPIEYDADGNPVDNIPRGDPGIERMGKAHARPEYALAQTEIRNIKTLDELFKWGIDNANRVESFPLDWQEIFRGQFRDRMLELGWKPKQQ